MIWESHFGTEESEVYGEALDALNSSSIRYMLGGALALNAHTGIWRDTKDLDVFVPKEVMPRVLETLEKAGFETEVEDFVWIAKAWRGELFVDVIRYPQRHRPRRRVLVRVREGDFHPRPTSTRHPGRGDDPLEDIRGCEGPLRRGRRAPPRIRHAREPRLGPYPLQDRRPLGASSRLPPPLPLR